MIGSFALPNKLSEGIQTTSTRLLNRPQVEREGKQALGNVHILNNHQVLGIKFYNNTESIF